MSNPIIEMTAADNRMSDVTVTTNSAYRPTIVNVNNEFTVAISTTDAGLVVDVWTGDPQVHTDPVTSTYAFLGE